MSYVRAYLSTFAQFMGYLGAGMLWLSAWRGNPLSIYLVGVSMIISIAGPIAVSLNKKEKQ